MVAICLQLSLSASAYNFTVDGLYYNIVSISDLTCAVTYDDVNDTEYSGDIVIPEQVTYNGRTLTVTSIGGSAFYGCSGLTSVSIPNSVTSIGGSAFYGCSGLASVSIPNSVTSMGEYVFDDCSGLTSVSIGNSVSSIGDYVFYGCSGLTSISIPNSVTSIGDAAFSGCSGLTSISIPNSVTEIEAGAFWGCRGLTSISIPNSVTRIGGTAFNRCDNLKNLRIEDGTETLVLGWKDDDEKLGLFSDCPLEVLYLGRNLEYPGSDVTTDTYQYSPFSGISSLSEVTIGSYVTEIGNYAFKGCTGLKTLRFEDGNVLLNVGANDFYSFNGPTYVVQGLFSDCPLETLYLGRNLGYETSFPYSSNSNSPFFGKTSLTEVTIGNTVTEIGSYLFDECDNLMTINSMPTTPPSVGSGNFTNQQYLDAKVYVPQGLLAAYQAADVWMNFWGLQEGTFTGISGVEATTGLDVSVSGGCIVVDNAIGRVTVYDISGAAVASSNADGGSVSIAVPGHGVYIVRVGGKAVKVCL